MRQGPVFGAALACIAVVFAAFAATPPKARSATVFVPGHAFGEGEQQVYAIAEHATLSVRFRQPDGRIAQKTLNVTQKRSVALTIEGYNQSGAPVMALAAAQSGKTAARAAGSAPAASPAVSSSGNLPLSGDAVALAPAAILLSGLSAQAPAVGAKWKSAGDLALPFGSLAVSLNNSANDSSGDENSTTLQVVSSGSARVDIKARVPAIGAVALRGAIPASAASFLELQRRLLLGMVVHASGRGNAAAAHGRRGSYALTVDYALKLARFAGGTQPRPGIGGYVPSSGYLGGIAPTDAGNLSPAPVSTIAQPAPTDTSFVPSPLPGATAATPAPAESLPPVPIIMPSDLPLASAPPAPSPSPS
jgi:hypothetical protein